MLTFCDVVSVMKGATETLFTKAACYKKGVGIVDLNGNLLPVTLSASHRQKQTITDDNINGDGNGDGYC